MNNIYNNNNKENDNNSEHEYMINGDEYTKICNIEELKNNLDLIKIGQEYKLYYLGPPNQRRILQGKSTAHMYMKIILENCFITLGLSGDPECEYKSWNTKYKGTRIHIPDWSIKKCATSNPPCYGYERIEGQSINLAQGKEYKSGILNHHQVLIIKLAVALLFLYTSEYLCITHAS